MSRHRFELVLEVDDEVLAEHDGDTKPPPNEVEDWTQVHDIEQAFALGIVDTSESTVESYEVEDE